MTTKSNIGPEQTTAMRMVFLHDPQLRVGEKAKFHRNWKGPNLVLDRVTEVTYKVKQQGCPHARVKTVHFKNLKLYQRATVGPPEPTITGQETDPDMGPGAVSSDGQQDDWVLAPPFKPSTSQLPGLAEHQEETGNAGGLSSPEPDVVQQLEPASSGHDPTPLVSPEAPQAPEQTPIEEDPGKDDQEEAPTRPRRERRPPDRYGDWEFNSIQVKNTLETLVHRLSDLERQREAQQRRIRRLKPHWLAEGRRLRQQARGE